MEFRRVLFRSRYHPLSWLRCKGPVREERLSTQVVGSAILPAQGPSARRSTGERRHHHQTVSPADYHRRPLNYHTFFSYSRSSGVERKVCPLLQIGRASCGERVCQNV